MSPHWLGLGGPVQKRADHTQEPLSKAFYNTMLHPARGEPDRVGDRPAAGVAVRDHREAAQAEQVGAAVGVRVEPGAQPPRRGPDQEAAELARVVEEISSRRASSSSAIVPRAASARGCR